MKDVQRKDCIVLLINHYTQMINSRVSECLFLFGGGGEGRGCECDSHSEAMLSFGFHPFTLFLQTMLTTTEVFWTSKRNTKFKDHILVSSVFSTRASSHQCCFPTALTLYFTFWYITFPPPQSRLAVWFCLLCSFTWVTNEHGINVCWAKWYSEVMKVQELAFKNMCMHIWRTELQSWSSGALGRAPYMFHCAWGGCYQSA